MQHKYLYGRFMRHCMVAFLFFNSEGHASPKRLASPTTEAQTAKSACLDRETISHAAKAHDSIMQLIQDSQDDKTIEIRELDQKLEGAIGTTQSACNLNVCFALEKKPKGTKIEIISETSLVSLEVDNEGRLKIKEVYSNSTPNPGHISTLIAFCNQTPILMPILMPILIPAVPEKLAHKLIPQKSDGHILGKPGSADRITETWGDHSAETELKTSMAILLGSGDVTDSQAFDENCQRPEAMDFSVQSNEGA